MTFAHPILLLVAPLAALLAWLMFRGDVVDSDSGRFPRIHRLWADRRGLRAVSGAAVRHARGLALAAAAALALLALARPQWGEVSEPTVSRAREVMLALDLSQSMLADDVSPTRLARARLLIDALLDALRGERVGLTVFAGTAFVQSPLSADYEVLRELLAGLDPTYLPQGGTDYAAMLRAALESFGDGAAGDRFLVVLSDGEAHDDAWQALLPTLRERGIRVVGLGIGTPAGAVVPDGDGGALKDADGRAVLSKLEPRTLQALAAQSGGTYRDAAAWVDIADLVGATVGQGRAGEQVEERHARLQDRFQWFLAPALLFFLVSYWLEFPVFPLARAQAPHRRRPRRGPATVAATALAGLIAWPTSPGQAQPVAADGPPPHSAATASPPSDLAATVAVLSARPQLAAADYARLATDTVGFAAQPTAPRGPARAGVIDDALAAVGRGERLDAGAADWTSLREQLEALRDPPEPPQQDQPQDGDSRREQPADQNAASAGAGQENRDPAQSGTQAQPGDADAGDPTSGGEDAPDAQAPAAEAAPDAQAKDPSAGAAEPSADGQPPERPDSGARAEAGQAGDTPPTEAARPLDAAGLEDADRARPEAPAPDQPADGEAASEPATATRSVGGGQVRTGREAAGDPAGGGLEALARQVEQGDAPAVLFERMARAEGRPRAAANAKNW